MSHSGGGVPPGRDAGAGSVITVLFTDIESSTRRWEEHPEAMASDLALHDEILRVAVTAAGGEIFSHTGDGMGAAFSDPAAAIAAAVAAQHGLAGAAWGAPVPLRARMGVHTGSVERRAGNYFGPTLNRAARLMAVGSGAQVLCSGATVNLIGAALPPEVALVDLGEHRLKDLGRPERVFQVAHPKLGADFPPLRSLRNHRHNLPVALDSFVGRAFEQKELAELLRESRLVSLAGVGGAGKTRLALQVAAGVIEHYPDGVWLVELAAVVDEALVASSVATALGLETGGISDAGALVEHVVTHLARKAALLIFDNCEHLIDASARLIHDLLARCPEITVLATSRETLGLPGEVVWKVPPLSLPAAGAVDPADVVASDAVTLFWERVTAARPGLELTPANVLDAARICRRLDGIPLALELAAARVPMLGVHEVAERMDDCFNLLTGGARTALPRQQTLRATLDWSYGLLAPAEQAALRRLAVFPAGFQFDAAEAVVLGGPGSDPPARGAADALSLVAALVDKSLVVVSDEAGEAVRYRLLQPVRQYGLERLSEAGEEQPTLRRHRDFCLALGASWGNNRYPDERMGRVTADQESFVAALEWSWNDGDFEAALHLAVALCPLWMFGGRPGGTEWLERVLAKTPAFEHPARVEALLFLAGMLSADPERRQAAWDEASRMARKLDDPYAIAFLDTTAAEGMIGSGQTEHARGMLENALSICEGLGYEAGIGTCHEQLGWLALAEDDPEQARRCFERAVELGRAAGSTMAPKMAHSLSALAPLYVRDGAVEDGLRLADEAVATARRQPIRLVEVMTLTRAGETALLAADPERAAGNLGDALRLLSALATLRYLGDCLELVALTLASRGDSVTASKMFGASAAVRDARGETSSVRILAAESRARRALLIDELGAEQSARHEADGRSLPPERAIALALAQLA